MKRSRMIVAAGLVSLGLVASATMPAQADPQRDLDAMVSADLERQLVEISAASGGDVTFDDVTVDVSEDLIEEVGSSSPRAIVDYILEEAEGAARTSPPPIESEQETQAKAARAAVTQSYTADQSTALPSIGVAWVAQDMSVTFNGSRVSSTKLKGGSYSYGASLFAYSHNYTEVSYSRVNTCQLTRMTGSFSAIVKGSLISFSSTVLAADGPRNGKMISLNTRDC